MLSKSGIRKKYKLLRNDLSDAQIDTLSMDIANRLLELPVWDASFYHIFLTIETHREVNTEYILHILAGKDKHIVVSKSNFDDFSMKHFLLTDATVLKLNAFQIPEPTNGIEIAASQLDVVFIPLLAYDTKGNRIGYGKGFYDRFLADCKPDVIKVGLSFFPPEETAIFAEATDIGLDFCVTPEKVYLFNE